MNNLTCVLMSLSAKDRLFGRYLFGNSNQLFPGNFDPFNQYQHFRGQNVVGGWTHIFSPTLINDARIGYQQDYLIRAPKASPAHPGCWPALEFKT